MDLGDLAKRTPNGWLTLDSGIGEGVDVESPRLRAMERRREKRAAARADDHQPGAKEAQRPSKARKMVEAAAPRDSATTSLQASHPPRPPLPPLFDASVLALLPPPTSNFLLLVPPGDPNTKKPLLLAPTTTTLQLFPKSSQPQLPPPKKECCIASLSELGKRGVGVTRVDGHRVTGSLIRFDRADDIVIRCDCHNRLFSPEGFVNHAGLKGVAQDNPLGAIWILKEHIKTENA